MLRAWSLPVLSLTLLVVASPGCLNQNNKMLPATTNGDGDSSDAESGDASSTGTNTNTDTGNTNTNTDTGSTNTDTGSTNTDTGSTNTNTDTGSTNTDTGSTATDTDTDTDTGGIPSGLPPFLGDALGLDEDDGIVTQLTDSVVMTPVQNMTFLGDCSDEGEAKPETDIEFVWGDVIDSLPMDPTGTGLIVTPPGAPPLGAGPYVIMGFKTVGSMHLDDPNRSFTLGMPTRTEGKTGWTNMSFPCDFYIGFNVWPQITGSSDGSGVITAEFSLTTLVGGNPVGQATTGQAFILGEFVLVVIPVSELGGNPQEFLATIHTHAGDFFTMACADISSGEVGVGHPI